jgi:hypothetical protein
MDERDAAQAAELVRALRDQLNEMTRQLVRLDRQHFSGKSSQGIGHPARSSCTAPRH